VVTPPQLEHQTTDAVTCTVLSQSQREMGVTYDIVPVEIPTPLLSSN
jgi:hypothetical protein